MGLFSIFSKKEVDKPKISDLKINLNSGTKFAENEYHDLYFDIEELGGFHFIKTIILGCENFTTKRKGCDLSITLNTNQIINLTSDNSDIESDKINNSPFYMTPIDFELSDSDHKLLLENTITELVINCNRKKEVFTPIKH